jgi:tetratricopeptide (TPR) repeat protein
MTSRTFLLMLALIAPAPVAAQEISVSAMDLLAYYEIGQHARVTRAVLEASRGDLVIVLDALKRDGAAWIAEDGPKWIERRRMVLATFALEVAHAGLEYQWTNSKNLLEWTCTLLRRERTASNFERAWHLAALALLEGSRDLEAIEIHLEHMKARLPDEPRLLLARAFVTETEWWNEVLFAARTAMPTPMPGIPNLPPVPGNSLEARDDTRQAIAAYLPFLKVPAIRNEAAMRLGFFSWRAGRTEEAVSYLGMVSDPDDAGQAYLLHLFLAWCHERLGKSDAAVTAYRAALGLVPGAQTASLHLAVRLHASGRGHEAKDVMEKALALEPPAFDPWRNFGYGDLRRWPALIAELRRLVK